MLEALNILEGFNLKQMGHNTAPYLHAVTESLKLSFADRNRYVGDPKFVPNIPMKALLSKEYAAVRRKAIDPNHAIAGEPAPGDPVRLMPSTQAYASAQPMPATVAPFDPDQILNLTTYLRLQVGGGQRSPDRHAFGQGPGSWKLVDRSVDVRSCGLVEAITVDVLDHANHDAPRRVGSAPRGPYAQTAANGIAPR